MNPSDIYSVLQWWLVLLLIGTGFLPLTFTLFDKFFDKGYIFSKIVGAGIVTYGIFLLGVLHVLPFSQVDSYVTFFLLAAIFFFVLPNKWRLFSILKRFWKFFLFEEITFLVALFFWVYIHSFAPDIHGLEKYMDFGFLNSILRSQYFPPRDVWFTPYPINYYYFGHLVTGVLTKLSGLPSNITFNIMMSTIFALCFTQTFSIGANLYTFLLTNLKISQIRRYAAGLLCASLITFAGNLHIIYAFFKPYNTDNPVPFWRLQFSPLTFPNAYWYPDATRFIYHTIHEFPIYSWTVADLHGHVLDIPFVLLMIGLLLSLVMQHVLIKKKDPYPSVHQNMRVKKILSALEEFPINPLYLFLIGFFLAVMYMTNAWDGPIYFLLTAFIVLYLFWRMKPEYVDQYGYSVPLKVTSSAKKGTKKPFLEAWFMMMVRDIGISLLFILFAFILVSFPFNLFFRPSELAEGLGVICAPSFLTKIGHIGPILFEANYCQRSYWWELLILYGFFYFFVVSFLLFLWKTKKVMSSDIFVLILVSLSTILIIIPEFVYVKDIYTTYFRANTMFKLVFEAFMMLQIASGYIIVRVLARTEREGRLVRYAVFLPITFILLVLVFSYPYFAINSYYGNLKTYKGLDGTAYLKVLYPTDYVGIQWLNKNVSGQPVILEAQGDSYTDYARVSSNTGLPTVLGWTVHEWLWRGSYSVPAPRIAQVQLLYTTRDLNVAKSLIKAYNVKYVFIGTLEYQKYPNLYEPKFAQLGKLVFHDGITKIYQLY